MKICTSCFIEKPFIDFYRKSESKDGLTYLCKKCHIARSQLKRTQRGDAAKEVSKAYYNDNKERIKDRVKTRYQDKAEKIKVKIKEWKTANPERVASTNAKRRAAKIKAIPRWFDLEHVTAFYELAQLFSDYFKEPFHVDHVVPLLSKLVCGLHWEGNLRIITGEENLRKKNVIWPDMP